MSDSVEVVVIAGSASDLPVVSKCTDLLKRLGVRNQLRIASAHRTPEHLHKIIRDGEAAGVLVWIAAAGYAAHLGGVIASISTRPVIGIPLDASSMQGFDSLLSTVQMPGGIPVACMGIGAAGAANAAIFAAQIVALTRSQIGQSIESMRQEKAKEIIEKDAGLHS